MSMLTMLRYLRSKQYAFMKKKDSLIAKILVSKYRGSPVSYGLKGTKVSGGFVGVPRLV